MCIDAVVGEYAPGPGVLRRLLTLSFVPIDLPTLEDHLELAPICGHTLDLYCPLRTKNWHDEASSDEAFTVWERDAPAVHY